MTPSRRILPIAYFVGWAGFGLLVHQSALADVIGSDPAGWLRRNSEAYVLLLLVPLYWELFAGDAARRPAGGTARRLAGASSRFVLPQFTWFALMAAATVVLQTSSLSTALGIPQSIVTLGESFFAAGVICAYLAWSRGFLYGAPAWRGMAVRSREVSVMSVVSPAARSVFYGAVALFTLALHQRFVADVIGSSATDWLKVNAEASGSMLIVPLWFDLVSRRRGSAKRIWTAGWLAFLCLVPVLTSAEVFERGVFAGTAIDSLSVWTGRTTEAFIAAAVIGLYFALVRATPARLGSRNSAGCGPNVDPVAEYSSL